MTINHREVYVKIPTAAFSGEDIYRREMFTVVITPVDGRNCTSPSGAIGSGKTAKEAVDEAWALVTYMDDALA